jgi:conjugal transfer pilus assembly protein TraA
MSKKIKSLMARVGVVSVVAAAASAPAVASTTNTDFDAVFLTLKDWTEGSLGRVLAISMILIGITMGVARQSIMAFAVGIAAGLGLYTAPTVIESVVSATL